MGPYGARTAIVAAWPSISIVGHVAAVVTARATGLPSSPSTTKAAAGGCWGRRLAQPASRTSAASAPARDWVCGGGMAFRAKLGIYHSWGPGRRPHKDRRITHWR